MAVGSNSLGLLFKIGVDAKDAEAVFRELMATNKEFAAGVEAGMKAELEATTQASQGLDKVAASSKATTTQINQLRAGFESVVRGDVLSGLGQIARAVGPAVVGVGALAIGILAATKAIEGMISAANEIGTDSKEDFDKLNKSVQAAGGSLTEADRAISQGLNKSFDTLHGAVTDLFAQLLGVAGPALKNLILDISGLIEDMKPLVRSIAVEIRNDLASLSAFINVIRIMKGILDQDLITGALVLDTSFIATLYEKAFDQALRAADEVGTATFKAVKGKKDLTQAQLEENEAARELALIRAQSARTDAETDRLEKAGLIELDEALSRRLATEQNIRNAEDALLDAQKKRIEEDVKGEKRKKDALEENANQRNLIATKSDADQEALAGRAAAELKKRDDKLIDDAIELDKKERELVDARNAFRIKSEIETQKAIADATAPTPEGGGVGAGIIQGLHDQVEALDPVTKAWREFKFEIGDALESSGIGFKGWSEFVTGAIKGVIDATEQLLTTFILTGKGGAAAFKALAAGIIASLAVQAGVEAILEIARGFRELANAAADAVSAPWKVPNDLLSAHMHFQSAAMFGIVAGAAVGAAVGIGASGGLSGGGGAAGAAGGGFGGETKPGEVTINQGSPGTLGIQLLSDIHSMLSTASPGDIVTRGAEQNPVAIGQANNEASRRDGSISREFLQISGLRTA